MSVSYAQLISHFDDLDLLYHYTTAETALTKILHTNSLLLSPLARMNDPMEFQDHPQMLSSDFDMDRKHMFRIFEEIEIAKRKRNDRVRLASFSIDRYDNKQTYTAFNHHKGWARSRMWTQYASNHSGVCLVFNKSMLVKSVEEEVRRRRLKNVEVLHMPVEYSNDVISYEKAFSIDISKENFRDDFTNFYLDNKEKFLFRKIEDYRDEQEYRVLLMSNQNKPLESAFFVRTEKVVSSVIVGCNFSDAYFPILKQYSETHKVPIFRINWEFGAPRMYSVFA